MDLSSSNVSYKFPTLMIIQGSYQLPEVYGGLNRQLSRLGYPVIQPKLPSCTDPGDPGFPSITLTEDASVVRQELQHQIEDEGNTVILIMHSYGGLVGNEATTRDLTWNIRQEQNLPGGVIHMFYYAAFCIEVGQSIFTAFEESSFNEYKPDGRMYMESANRILYNDLTPSEASLWASRVIAVPLAIPNSKLTKSVYDLISSTYLVCENDQNIAVQWQEKFATTANATIIRCGAGHSPMLSQPDLLVEIIKDISR